MVRFGALQRRRSDIRPDLVRAPGSGHQQGMMFRRLCDRCGDLVVCSRGDKDDLLCSRCGGTLVGPVALPVPESYRQRVDILLSPHYVGAVATREPR